MHPIQIALLIMLLLAIGITMFAGFIQWQNQKQTNARAEAASEVDIDLSDYASFYDEFKSPAAANDKPRFKLPRFAILYQQGYEVLETVPDGQAGRVRAWLHDLELPSIFTPAYRPRPGEQRSAGKRLQIAPHANYYYSGHGELVSGFNHVWTKPGNRGGSTPRQASAVISRQQSAINKI